jgi:hypothetical protein
MRVQPIPDFSRNDRHRRMGVLHMTTGTEDNGTGGSGTGPANVIVPGTLTPLDATSAAVLAKHSGGATIEIPGFVVPASAQAMKAGSMALANAMALDLQKGNMSPATFNAAIAALIPNPK